MSGTSVTRPLAELAEREPAVWAGLVAALARVEEHWRDACHVEFTYESGVLWLLQVRRGGLTGRAAIRVAVELADEGVLTRREALHRVSPRDVHQARTPGLDAAGAELLARGIGACPGVAVGRVATTAEAAIRMAPGGPVVLVRPETSPADMAGLAAAAGIVTARGGPTSHAAVVARSMGKPAVVGVAGLVVDESAGVTFGGSDVSEGSVVTIDGTDGAVVLGHHRVTTPTADPHLCRLLGWADDVSGDVEERPDVERLTAAHAVLGDASGE